MEKQSSRILRPHSFKQGLTGYLESVWVDVVRVTQWKINWESWDRSIWFPYGELGFGWHYSKKQISEMLESVDLRELWKKWLKLRGLVAWVVMAITLWIHAIPSWKPDTKIEPTTQSVKK